MTVVKERMVLSGDEAVALGALHAGVALGTGYPGTPSTEILEAFSALGGRAQWAPNEKVAAEVALGVAFAKARALVTMKHVGVNVAADVLFTAAYSGVSGALVMVSADDPGMSSSQNEQDNRRYAVAAGVPMLEPADSQEAYDYTIAAFEMSQRWGIPVMLRLTTRVCHSKTIVRADKAGALKQIEAGFERNIKERVMIPGHARPAHLRLRKKLKEVGEWVETCGFNRVIPAAAAGIGDRVSGIATPDTRNPKPGIQSTLGIISSGVAAIHAMEAAPDAAMLKIGTSYPLPMYAIRRFVASVEECVVIEEGDPYLEEAILAAGVKVRGKPEMYRFGELNVSRVRRILANDTSPEPAIPRGKPPQLCPGCPYRSVFEVLKKLDCIVAGDIGCYTLAALPPFEAMDTQICMGASLGVGLGLRHVLPEKQAKKVVSVIGDSTFMHSGLTGLAEMVYNPPKSGHVLLILDNGITAMTGQQEHPGTGRTLEHEGTNKVSIEGVARAMGVKHVDVIDPVRDREGFEKLMQERLASDELAVVVARKVCLLAAGDIAQYDKQIAQKQVGACGAACDCAKEGGEQ